MRELPLNPDESRDFESLVSEHRRGLKAFLLTIVQDYHLAEDILQESLSIVAEKWASGEVRDFWAFSREVVRRQALTAVRKMQNQPVPLSEEALESLQAAFESLSATPDKSRTVALHGCMQKLPHRWLKILNLRYWESEKINAIALKLNIHANVVSVTINRAKSRLADCVSAFLNRATRSTWPSALTLTMAPTLPIWTSPSSSIPSDFTPICSATTQQPQAPLLRPLRAG